MSGSNKHHQQLHRSKLRLVNLVHHYIEQEAIKEPEDKIDLIIDETLLQVQIVLFKGRTKGNVF